MNGKNNHKPDRVWNVKSLARCHTELAINVLSGVAKSSASDSARVSAATELLNRGWGRAPVDVNDGEQLTIVIRKILEIGPAAKVIEP